VVSQGFRDLEWAALRPLWVPLWCRSTATLKRMAEDLCATAYRRTQDPMQVRGATRMRLKLGIEPPFAFQGAGDAVSTTSTIVLGD
jgi:hypothetical protein